MIKANFKTLLIDNLINFINIVISIANQQIIVPIKYYLTLIDNYLANHFKSEIY